MGHKSTTSGSSVVNFRAMPRDRRNGLNSLPPPRANRWVARQKQAVVEAVNTGRLPLHEAMRRYELSLEEFMTWQEAFAPKVAPQATPKIAPRAVLQVATLTVASERRERVLEAVA